MAASIVGALLASRPAAVSLANSSANSGDPSACSAMRSRISSVARSPNIAFAIARDAFGNFITNIAASSWSLTNVSGGVVSGDLVPSGDLKSATFTAAAPGVAKIRVTSGALTAGNSGYLTVYSTGNFPPTITTISNRTTIVGRAVGPFDITVGDAETPTGLLTIAASSSNTNLVPNANFIIFNSGVTTFTVQPADGQTGVATITVSVNDGTTSRRIDGCAI